MTCMTCAQVGCCDSSKNKHAHEVDHPIIALSAEPGEVWMWCYVDDTVLGRSPQKGEAHEKPARQQAGDPGRLRRCGGLRQCRARAPHSLRSRLPRRVRGLRGGWATKTARFRSCRSRRGCRARRAADGGDERRGVSNPRSRVLPRRQAAAPARPDGPEHGGATPAGDDARADRLLRDKARTTSQRAVPPGHRGLPGGME